MTEVKLWRLFCTSTLSYEYVWNDTEPTTCPTNTAHSIDAAQTSVIRTISEDMVTIREEIVETQGIYKFQGYNYTIPAGTPGDITTISLSWPRPITLLNGDFDAIDVHVGDRVDGNVTPTGPIGAITAPVAIGATVLSVSPTVLENLYSGFQVTISDGTNTDVLGECMSLDKINSTITVETATTHAFSPLTPSYIFMSAEVVSNLHVRRARTYEFAKKKMQGKNIPANVPFVIHYTNNSGVQKDFSFNFEFIY